MPNISSSPLNQLFADTRTSAETRKGKAGTLETILGNTGAIADFQTLISKINAGSFGASITISKIGTTSSVTGDNTAKNPLDFLNALTVTPELLAALKALTPDQLVAAANGQLTLDAQMLGILDALARIDLGSAGADSKNLFEIISDGNLAKALQGIYDDTKMLQATESLPAQLPFGHLLQTALKTANPLKDAATLASSSAATLGPITATVSVDAATGTHTITLQTTPDNTITIADLNIDEFDAFKRLAFADLAPFLTQPRLVRIDGNNVMKVAQGPSFLHDNGAQDTAMTLLAGLVPVLAKVAQEVSANGAQKTTIVITPKPQLPQATTGESVLSKTLASPLGSLGSVTADAQPAATATGPIMPSIPSQGMSVSPHLNATQTQQTLATVTSNAATRGFEVVAKGLDNGLEAPETFDLEGFLENMVSIEADQSAPQNSTLALLTSKNAANPHPSAHLVSTIIQKMAGGNPAIPGDDRQFVIQLDPPSLGRLKITLEFSENQSVRAKLVAERPETIAMLQKDAALLERALQNSGFDASAPGAITFDLSKDGSGFGGSNGHGSENYSQKNGSSDDDGTDLATIETVMPIFVDPLTGLTHVNVVI